MFTRRQNIDLLVCELKSTSKLVWRNQVDEVWHLGAKIVMKYATA